MTMKELVRVPIESVSYTSQGATASTTNNTNQDGSGFDVAITSTTVIGQSGGTSWLRAIVHGSVVGIRFNRLDTNPPFAGIIDGVPYRIPKYKRIPYFGNQIDASLRDWDQYIILADDLDPDIEHTVEIAVPVDPSGAKTLRFFGFVAEKSLIYKEPIQDFSLYGNTQLSGSMVAVSRSFGTDLPNVKTLAGLVYRNTDVGPVRVTLTSNGAYYLMDEDIPAGGVRTFWFPQPVNFASALQHMASVSAKVNVSLIGRI